MAHCKPFLKWAGGKTRLLPELRARMPRQYGRYLEPFVGSGALFFECQPPHSYLADSNSDLVNAYTVVRDELDALIADLSEHKYEKEYYYTVRNADRAADYASWTPVRRASRLIYLNRTCFNGLYRVNAKGEFNVPFGRYKNPTICDARTLTACHRALRHAEVACAPFTTVVDLAAPGDFVYFDPPYAPVSKTSNFTAYDAAGFDTDAQEALKAVCDALDEKGVQFMLSNSFSEIARELYKAYRVEVVSATRPINARADRRGHVSELIVRNY